MKKTHLLLNVTFLLSGLFTGTPFLNLSPNVELSPGNAAQILSANISAVEDVPVAADDSNTTDEDTPVNGDVSLNDTPSGDGGNTWAVTSGPEHGTVAFNSDGTYTYTPEADYNGLDSIEYQLCDIDNDCSTGLVRLTINAVSDLPVAADDSNTTDEDTPVNGNVSLNDTPSGDGGNTWAVTSGPEHGTVAFNSDGTYTYTPEADYNGLDSIEYQLCDIDNDCSTGLVRLTINAVSDLPVAADDSNTTDEDTPVNGNVSLNDIPSGDGGNTWAVTSGPEHGTVAFNSDGTYTYTPEADYNGLDSIEYQLCDIDNDCSTGLVRLTINAVSDLPVAADDSNTTDEDNLVNGDVSLNDTPSGDGGNTWAVTSGPEHGTVAFNSDGTYTYTPEADYNGLDSIEYQLCDIDNDCSTGLVRLTINAVSDLPVAADDSNTTDEDTPVNGDVSLNDTPSGDGGNTWAVTSGPEHGTVAFNSDGTYTYTPEADYNGLDSIEYQLCDIDNDCSTGLVRLTINAVSDLPVAADDSNTTDEDTPVNGDVSLNDTPSGDGGNTWAVTSGPEHGTVAFNSDGTYTYTPEADYNGLDSIEYQLCDIDNDCSTGLVRLTINAVSDLPVAADDSNTTDEDTPVNGNVSLNDTPSGDGGNTWAVTSGPEHGTVAFNSDGTYTYTPEADYNGLDSIEYQLCDIDNDCSTGLVRLTINAVSDLPVAADDSNTTDEDTPVNGDVSLNDTPSGDGGNTWAVTSGPEHGTVAFNSDGTYTYTPEADYNGLDSIEYQLCDIDNDCSTGLVRLTINAVSDLPVAADDSNTTDEDTPVNGDVSLNDTPSGDGGNTWAVTSGPEHGTVAFNSDGTYTYTPEADYNGLDSIEYQLCDIDNDCSTGLVRLTINAVSDLPVAADDSNTTDEDTPVNGDVSLNDTPSGDGGNTWAVTSGPEHGTVAFNSDGTYTYTPEADYNGLDSIEYQLCDIDNDCSTGLVRLTINAVSDLPVAADDSNTTDEDNPINGDVSLNDTPSGDGGNTWAVTIGPEHGTVAFNSDGTYTYTPEADYNGLDSIEYQLCDIDNDCSTGLVRLTINAVSDLPEAVCQDVTVQLDATGNASVTPEEVNDGSTAEAGIKSLSLDRTDFTCSDISSSPIQVTLTVTDNNDNTATCTAEVTVEDNTAPTAICQNVILELDENGNGILPARRR